MKLNSLYCGLVGAAFFIAALFVATPAFASISVTIAQPTSGALVNSSSMTVSATVTSTFALSTVHAQVGTLGQDLTYSNGSWSGTLSLASLSSGVFMLTVTATDVNSATGSTQEPFVYDLPPVVNVTSPARWSVARPELYAAATCSDVDSGGCTSLTAYYTTTVATGVSSISQMIDLTAEDPSFGRLSFIGTDSYLDVNGQTQHQTTTVYVDIEVDSSSTLHEVEAVSGEILDADCTRLLVLDPDGQTIKIYDRGTGTYTVIAMLPPVEALAQALTPTGALLINDNPSVYPFPYTDLFEWRSNTLTLLDHPNSGGFLAVAGNWAIWADQPNLILRDLTTGTNTTVSTSAGNDNDGVAPNGDVVYWGTPDFQIYRWRSGTTTQLTNDSYRHAYPLTDGINVVYYKTNSPMNASTPTYSTALYGAGGEVLLDTDDSVRQPRPGKDYQVKDGWVAYTAPAGGALQVFTIDPSGATHQLTEFGARSTIDGLDSSGAVTLIENGRRYFASAGTAPTDVSGPNGTSISIGGVWNVMLGRSLFQIADGVDGGAGVSCGSMIPVTVPDLSMAAVVDLGAAPDASANVDLGSTQDASASVDLGVDHDLAVPGGGGGSPGGTPPSSGGCSVSAFHSTANDLPFSGLFGLLLSLALLAFARRRSAR